MWRALSTVGAFAAGTATCPGAAASATSWPTSARGCKGRAASRPRAADTLPPVSYTHLRAHETSAHL
eukprot:7008254-Alexandrium_andersonii.AAC.1